MPGTEASPEETSRNDSQAPTRTWNPYLVASANLLPEKFFARRCLPVGGKASRETTRVSPHRKSRVLARSRIQSCCQISRMYSIQKDHLRSHAPGNCRGRLINHSNSGAQRLPLSRFNPSQAVWCSVGVIPRCGCSPRLAWKSHSPISPAQQVRTPPRSPARGTSSGSLNS
jgi:hypothetical protein